MESVKVLTFLCLVLVSVFHLSNGQCKEWSEEELTGCLSQRLCYECSKECECDSGYVKGIEGYCIPEFLCKTEPSKEGVRVARAAGCNNCDRYCGRLYFKQGRCINHRCVCV